MGSSASSEVWSQPKRTNWIPHQTNTSANTSTNTFDTICSIASARVERCVALCVEQNLTPVVSFILFGPMDTAGTIRETLALARRLFECGAEIAYTEMLIPYPGTPIAAQLKKDGKYREAGEAYYFESCRGLDTNHILRLLDAARRMAAQRYGGEPHAQQRRLYREFGCLDDLLAGNVQVPECLSD